MTRDRPSSDVVVRRAREEDAPAIADIWFQGWHEAHSGRVPEALLRHRDHESFQRRASERLSDVFVAEAAGLITGFVRVKGDELEQIFVSAHHRGRQVAPALMQAALDALAAKGVTRAFLVVNGANESAIRFYRRYGWVEGALVDYEAEIEGGTLTVPVVRFERPV